MRLADRGGCLESANTAAPSLTPPRPYGVKFIRCASLRSTHPTRPALEANTLSLPPRDTSRPSATDTRNAPSCLGALGKRPRAASMAAYAVSVLARSRNA
jgi:hypothetical protein